MLINGKRSLAYIAKITNEMPIENCANIKLVTINDGWNCIAKKEELQVGDLCVYFEIDSKVPAKEPFLFLENKKYKVKSMKMRGVVSQGLAMPLSLFKNLNDKQLGDDVTEVLGVTHTEDDLDGAPITKTDLKGLKKFLMKFKCFRKLLNKKNQLKAWPKEISKTDEERIENCAYLLNSSENWVATEKIDGTSTTYFMRKVKKLFGYKYQFTVCSRNLVQDDPNTKDNIYWFNAKKYHIEEIMKEMLKSNNFQKWLCIQGESIGPKVQGNRYNVTEPEFYVFNIITSDEGRLPSVYAKIIAEKHNLKHVPIIHSNIELPKTMKEMKELADGNSVLSGKLREGLVFRSLDGQRSFKNVSIKYLLTRWEK